MKEKQILKTLQVMNHCMILTMCVQNRFAKHGIEIAQIKKQLLRNSSKNLMKR